jgi:hypothetical protein
MAFHLKKTFKCHGFNWCSGVVKCMDVDKDGKASVAHSCVLVCLLKLRNPCDGAWYCRPKESGHLSGLILSLRSFPSEYLVVSWDIHIFFNKETEFRPQQFQGIVCSQHSDQTQQLGCKTPHQQDEHKPLGSQESHKPTQQTQTQNRRTQTVKTNSQCV